ncbi:hypothetical protein [Demequina lignilytica]|uniref:Polymer-forming cytoskeletal protein n=1 Tax=Demequina lignilytica TaxID=3051663 RepID=A0AB35ME70_9MICO|nr:hypothetical protein [Demequina sp. SYSU T0a273]MDN4482051.1 hypothetical protein [Demequina sp. SYSU T0a273]
MTLMIMVVGAILIATLVAVTMFNSAVTSKTRAEMHVLASADAGIDMVIGLLEGKTYEQLASVCGPMSFTINNDAVTVTTEYQVGGSTKACPSSTEVASAVTISSTATSGNVPVANEVVSRTVEAVLYATPEQVDLDKAIFSEDSTIITSNTYVKESAPGEEDAHIYTNGGFICDSQQVVQGSIIAAHGDIYFKNDCDVSTSVWASGSVEFASGTHVYGDVYSSTITADPAITISGNNAYVGGSLIANGTIDVKSEVTGNIVSLDGSVITRDGTDVGKNVFAADGIEFNKKTNVDGNASTLTTIATNPTFVNGNNYENVVVGTATAETISVALKAGTKVEVAGGGNFKPSMTGLPPALGYPAEVQDPPRQQLPILTMDAEDIALWQNDGYKVTITSSCDAPGALTAVNGADYGSQGKALVIFEGCSKPVNFANNSVITLQGDLGLVSTTGFRMDNQTYIKSTVSPRPDMHWIVPADSPNVTWPWPTVGTTGQSTPQCASEAARTVDGMILQDIYFQKVKNDGANVFIYTPCTAEFTTGWSSDTDPFTGQIYAGDVDLHNSFDLKMTKVNVPSNADKTPALNKLANFQLISRYDLFS